jgi:hypothetical protein
MARLFEAYHGRKPAVGFFRTFRCVGFVKDKNPDLKKLGDRSALMVFIGYSKGAKAYRMLQPSTRRVHVSCDVVFNENRGWSWTSGAGNGEPATQRDFTVKLYSACASDINIDGPPQGGAPPSPPRLGTAQAPLQTPPPAGEAATEFATLISDDERLDAFHDDLLVRYRRMNQVIGDEPILG